MKNGNFNIMGYGYLKVNTVFGYASFMPASGPPKPGWGFYGVIKFPLDVRFPTISWDKLTPMTRGENYAAFTSVLGERPEDCPALWLGFGS
jgi:hypothetical protein